MRLAILYAFVRTNLTPFRFFAADRRVVQMVGRWLKRFSLDKPNEFVRD
jgi:hypothetical protein